ncbi:MAG: bifunctional phosphoglucose/phosphomannose isomerase [Candidatus Berkelbacteria bacterium]
MTNNLDNIEAMRKLDTADILQKTREMPEQIERCWSDWKTIAIPAHFATAKNVLILGMGGSGIGAALTIALAKYDCPMVVEVSRDYNIPAWVDKSTLVIGVSFSGNTEETLEGFRQAANKTEKLITISTGGKLASLGSQHRALHYQINYDSQPRSAIGFSLTSLLAIFAKLRFLEIRDNDMNEVVTCLNTLLEKIDADVLSYRNPAKLLAQKLVGKIPVILGSGVLAEVARRWKGHLNENAKNQAYFEEIPEMNHNALVGLEYPEELGKKVFFILLESKFNLDRNKRRSMIVSQILTQRKVGFESVSVDTNCGRIAEMYQMIMFGDFVAYYLAILNNVEPEPVKIITFLKDRLAEKE